MARKPRLEVDGGLYHLVTRGVDRRDIFHSPQDHAKFVSILAGVKGKLPFYLYAYCLMTNHIHLLIERMADDVGKIMHRLLTGYSQYYNRKYRRSGHLFQGRHRAILCQSDRYLSELVRYIHLNPVRAGMVVTPEEYPHSSHPEYLGLAGMTDVGPVLRRFGPKPAVARERYAEFVTAAVKSGRQEQFYDTDNGILGSDEFVDEMIHRIGEFDARAAALRRKAARESADVNFRVLLDAVEAVCGIPREEICGPAKSAKKVFAKEILIVVGRQLGASVTDLAHTTGLTSASISRRHDVARHNQKNNPDFSSIVESVRQKYAASSCLI